MFTSKLSHRKPDALDTWNDLFQQRYQAYVRSDWNAFKRVNDQLKDIRRNGGWSESEIGEEFQVYDSVLSIPKKRVVGNTNISYDLIENGLPQNHTLNIYQVSMYWGYRNNHKTYIEALSFVL